MRTKLLHSAALCISVLFLNTSCQKEDNPQLPDAAPPAPVSNQRALIDESNNFGFELYRELREDEAGENILFSPLSVSMALGMTMNGARTFTYENMRTSLGFGELNQEEINAVYLDLLNDLPSADPNTTTNIVNSIWHDNNFSALPEFIETNQTYFNATVEGLDFDDEASVDIINNWVIDATNGKIDGIIDQIPPDAVMYLINALYFNAPWTVPFDPEQTALAYFYRNDGVHVQTPVMSSESIPFGHYSDESVQVVDLPYGNEKYRFTAVLPHYSSNVSELAASINANDFDHWVQNLDYNHSMKLRMARFEFEFKKNLLPSLEEIGMNAMGHGADFTGIHPSEPLKVSRVLHKTYITVTEDGTEAAAVTAVEMVTTGEGPPQVSLDRPFIFVIREVDSGAILFVGQLMDPTA